MLCRSIAVEGSERILSLIEGAEMAEIRHRQHVLQIAQVHRSPPFGAGNPIRAARDPSVEPMEFP